MFLAKIYSNEKKKIICEIIKTFRFNIFCLEKLYFNLFLFYVFDFLFFFKFKLAYKIAEICALPPPYGDRAGMGLVYLLQLDTTTATANGFTFISV